MLKSLRKRRNEYEPVEELRESQMSLFEEPHAQAARNVDDIVNLRQEKEHLQALT